MSAIKIFLRAFRAAWRCAFGEERRFHDRFWVDCEPNFVVSDSRMWGVYQDRASYAWFREQADAKRFAALKMSELKSTSRGYAIPSERIDR